MEILRERAATIEPEGLLRLTDQKPNVTGTAFYRKPVRLRDHTNLSTKAKVRSFSTSIVFLISPSSSRNGGFGFTLTLSPTPAVQTPNLDITSDFFNEINDGNPTNNVFAVEFDSERDGRDDRTGNHVGLNFNSAKSNVQEPVGYDDDNNEGKQDFAVESVAIRARLDHYGPTQTLNLIVSPATFLIDPSKPLISQQEEMYVGFMAATGKDKSSAHYVMGWSFSSGRDGSTSDRLLQLENLPLWQQLNTGKNKGYESLCIY